MLERLRIAQLERKGFNALADGSYQTAVAAFTELIEREPTRTGTRHNLGLAHLGAEEFEKAEARFLEDLELQGEYYPRVKVLGDLYYIWGKREEADRWYRKALRLTDDPKSSVLLETRIGQTASDTAFDQVFRADVAYKKGIEELKAAQYEDSLRHFQEAADLNPTHVLAWNNAGTILMNQFSRYEEARDAFQEALRWEEIPLLQMNLQKVAEAISMRERKSRSTKKRAKP